MPVYNCFLCDGPFQSRSDVVPVKTVSAAPDLAVSLGKVLTVYRPDMLRGTNTIR
jgi:hypothetical protein